MTHEEATDFIRPAVIGRDGDWADLGAGAGTFTAALATLLGARHVVTAVDRDARHVRELATLSASLPPGATTIRALLADLADPSALEPIAPGSQAGVLFGNVLHYFADPLPLLRAAPTRLRPDGALVVLEYEGARANPWVPYPLSLRRLGGLAKAAGLAAPAVVSATKSRYHGTLYCAVLTASAARKQASPRR
jgi:SAM-dependent methyltransferase